MAQFKLVSDFKPRGDQPAAIESLLRGVKDGRKHQTLLGVTGSGKTYTMANVIAEWGRPVLIISHNKTLAAQLYGEFKGFFPHNAVEYFISYYDYYQPEAYVPATDTYIEKDTSVNEEIDRLRLKATTSLMERDDVIIVASVSCIYNLGSPKEYGELLLFIKKGEEVAQRQILRRLIDIHYTRNDLDFHRGTFRVRGDVIEIFPAYEESALRIEMFGNTIERIVSIDTLTGEIKEEKERAAVYPAKHFVTTTPRIEAAIHEIRRDLEKRLAVFRKEGKLLEAQRLETRTNFDIEMMQEVGYCSGIENYSRYMAGRSPGERPFCLIDYFPDPFLLIIDESHATLPQIRAMYNGDHARKMTLVDHGFRLPSALDNRPLKFDEFETLVDHVIYVSATPADYELDQSGGEIIEQIIRPTGLMDPEVVLKPTKTQIDDLIAEIRGRVARGERTLVTTLTKRMSEDLADYLANLEIRVRYLHSEIAALDRMEILRGLRLADFDVLVGINLLREGLDLPEVSLVAILDADKEGFLRSERSLMQIAGRAARHSSGRVILYADRITDSIRGFMSETERRRKIQQAYNIKHGITPSTIEKSVEEVMAATRVADSKKESYSPSGGRKTAYTKMELEEQVDLLEKEMLAAAQNLEFERAAEIRDEIALLKGGSMKGGGNYRRKK